MAGEMVDERFVLPGDVIQLPENITDISLGPNIIESSSINTDTDSDLVPTTAGFLNIQQNRRQESSAIVHIEKNTKRYIPQVGDYVIGVIVQNFGTQWTLNLKNFNGNVVLSHYAFPNANRKNRPNYTTGDLIYARVETAERDLGCNLSCIDPVTGKDGGFGILKEGYVVEVKLAYARYLLFNQNAEILEKLMNKVKFEIAIGVNGKIWINTDNLKTTIAAARCIQESQNWVPSEMSANVNKIFSSLDL